ncbi:MAG: hypothetical protein ACRCZ9_00445 [Fusobacteriaceae bacterium]
MNFSNFKVNFKNSLIGQTLYATEAVQEIAEIFESYRYQSGIPTARNIIQQVLQGLMPVAKGFALIALVMYRQDHQRQLSEDKQKRDLIKQVASLKSLLLESDRQLLASSLDLNSAHLVSSLSLKNDSIKQLSAQVDLLKAALAYQQTADSSQKTADSSQKTAYELLSMECELLKQQLADAHKVGVELAKTVRELMKEV